MQQNKPVILKIIVIVCFILMLLFWRLSPKVKSLDEYSLDIMGTQTHIMVIAKDKKTAKKCIDAAMFELEHAERLMSYHDPNSLLSMINNSAFEKEATCCWDCSNS